MTEAPTDLAEYSHDQEQRDRAIRTARSVLETRAAFGSSSPSASALIKVADWILSGKRSEVAADALIEGSEADDVA